MSDSPFRDELSAALARVNELEIENRELAARAKELEEKSRTSEAMVTETLTTNRGFVRRTLDESEEAHRDLATLKESLAKATQELALVHREQRASSRAQNPQTQSKMIVVSAVVAFGLGCALGRCG